MAPPPVVTDDNRGSGTPRDVNRSGARKGMPAGSSKKGTKAMHLFHLPDANPDQDYKRLNVPEDVAIDVSDDPPEFLFLLMRLLLTRMRHAADTQVLEAYEENEVAINSVKTTLATYPLYSPKEKYERLEKALKLIWYQRCEHCLNEMPGYEHHPRVNKYEDPPTPPSSPGPVRVHAGELHRQQLAQSIPDEPEDDTPAEPRRFECPTCQGVQYCCEKDRSADMLTHVKLCPLVSTLRSVTTEMVFTGLETVDTLHASMQRVNRVLVGHEKKVAARANLSLNDKELRDQSTRSARSMDEMRQSNFQWEKNHAEVMTIADEMEKLFSTFDDQRNDLQRMLRSRQLDGLKQAVSGARPRSAGKGKKKKGPAGAVGSPSIRQRQGTVDEQGNYVGRKDALDKEEELDQNAFLMYRLVDLTSNMRDAVLDKEGDLKQCRRIIKDLQERMIRQRADFLQQATVMKEQAFMERQKIPGDDVHILLLRRLKTSGAETAAERKRVLALENRLKAAHLRHERLSLGWRAARSNFESTLVDMKESDLADTPQYEALLQVYSRFKKTMDSASGIEVKEDEEEGMQDKTVELLHKSKRVQQSDLISTRIGGLLSTKGVQTIHPYPKGARVVVKKEIVYVEKTEGGRELSTRASQTALPDPSDFIAGYTGGVPSQVEVSRAGLSTYTSALKQDPLAGLRADAPTRAAAVASAARPMDGEDALEEFRASRPKRETASVGLDPVTFKSPVSSRHLGAQSPADSLDVGGDDEESPLPSRQPPSPRQLSRPWMSPPSERSASTAHTSLPRPKQQQQQQEVYIPGVPVARSPENAPVFSTPPRSLQELYAQDLHARNAIHPPAASSRAGKAGGSGAASPDPYSANTAREFQAMTTRPVSGGDDVALTVKSYVPPLTLAPDPETLKSHFTMYSKADRKLARYSALDNWAHLIRVAFAHLTQVALSREAAENHDGASWLILFQHVQAKREKADKVWWYRRRILNKLRAENFAQLEKSVVHLTNASNSRPTSASGSPRLRQRSPLASPRPRSAHSTHSTPTVTRPLSARSVGDTSTLVNATSSASLETGEIGPGAIWDYLAGSAPPFPSSAYPLPLHPFSQVATQDLTLAQRERARDAATMVPLDYPYAHPQEQAAILEDLASFILNGQWPSQNPWLSLPGDALEPKGVGKSSVASDTSVPRARTAGSRQQPAARRKGKKGVAARRKLRSAGHVAGSQSGRSGSKSARTPRAQPQLDSRRILAEDVVRRRFPPLQRGSGTGGPADPSLEDVLLQGRTAHRPHRPTSASGVRRIVSRPVGAAPHAGNVFDPPVTERGNLVFAHATRHNPDEDDLVPEITWDSDDDSYA